MEVGAILAVADSISSGNLIASGLLVLLGIPASILAWHSIRDRDELRRQRDQREADQRVTELVGAAFFGPDKSQWPTPDQLGHRPTATDLLLGVAHQVRPSNGKTVATMVEEIKGIVSTQAEQVDDLNQGMAKLAILMTEHVSDGHGGQRSW